MTDNSVPLLHYSPEPFLYKPFVIEQNHGEGTSRGSGMFMKPRGLWLSGGDGEGSWREWCESEQFRISDLLHIVEVVLVDNAKVLQITTVEELDAFHNEYALGMDEVTGVKRRRGGSEIKMWVDWNRLAKKYDGIVIVPYQWNRRMDGEATWYYSWDCASACIWNSAAIATVRPYKGAFHQVFARACRILWMASRDWRDYWRRYNYRRKMRTEIGRAKLQSDMREAMNYKNMTSPKAE